VARNKGRGLPGKLLKRSFFEAPPELVAPRVLGKVLACRGRSGWMAGRIVEIEAYLGPDRQIADPAAHTYRGPTARNRVLFGPAGHAYVYFIYGQYFCMNISCEKEGQGGGVLLRALEPLTGLEQMARNRRLDPSPLLSAARSAAEKGGATRRKGPDRACELASGPGRLCQALDITRSAHNGLDLLDPESPLQVRDDGFQCTRVLVTTRIGIRHAADLPLRFALIGNPCVSGSKTIAGKIISLHSLSLRRLK